jgi:DNA-binding MarR family transcriptional regulator
MFKLQITNKGYKTLSKLKPIILNNRSQALKGLSDEQIKQFKSTLNQITENCSEQD